MSLTTPLSSSAPVSALVIAPPGRLRDSLLRLLASLPGVQAVHHAADAAAARAALAQVAADIVILDWDLWGPEAAVLLRAARERGAGERPAAWVGLIGGERQQAAAWEAGVDAVLVKGFSVQEVEAAVRRCAALSPARDLTGQPAADR